YSPTSGGEIHTAPRLENRPPPRLRRYSPTSGGEIHTAPRLENRPPPPPRRYSPTSGGEIHTAPPSGEPTPSPTPPVPPPTCGRNPYGPTSGEPPPPPATPIPPPQRGRNPYRPHVWRTDPIPGYAGTPPQAGEKSMRTSELDPAALLSRQIGGVDDTGDIGREIEARERLTVMCHRLHEVLDLGRVPADHLVGDEGLVPPQLGREHLGQLEVLDPLFVEEVGLQHVGGCQVCVEDRVVAVDLEEVARPA